MLALKSVAAFAVGTGAWTFAEYGLHNWYGHKAKGGNHFSREHLKHHRVKDYFGPSDEKIMASSAAAASIVGVGSVVLGLPVAAGLSAGFVGGWGAYEVVHRRLHTHAPRGRYGRFVRKHHFAHHFQCPNKNHGVTSHIWDVVFRTHQPVDQVRVPPTHAMDWLLDEQGAIRPEFERDYVLRKGRSRSKAAKVAKVTPTTEEHAARS